jgi:hypothetical protein
MRRNRCDDADRIKARIVEELRGVCGRFGLRKASPDFIQTRLIAVANPEQPRAV